MRVLVACSSCKRQYDASGREAGDRFRCLCGETITMPERTVHEAAVVRCSSCGSTRQRDATSCAHCGSDFTLHERDLHTICPGCATRVSDRARFCHHCATLLDPHGRAGEETSKSCPVCRDGHHLTSRDFGVDGLSILECPSCAGLWLGHAAFRHLVERTEATAANARIHAMAASRSHATAGGTLTLHNGSGRFYRPCLECGEMMQRRNYEERSGVIVDVCAAHGVWFDDDELAKILRWIRSGRARLAREQMEENRRARERRNAPKPVAGSFPPATRPADGVEPLTILEFLLEVCIFIFRVLR